MSGIEKLLDPSSQAGKGDPSPKRAQSPTTSEELNVEDEDYDDDDKSSYAGKYDSKSALTETHDGPQTGVKGVRTDAARQAKVERQRRDDEVRSTNKRLEGMALGKSRTWDVEDSERKEEMLAGVKPGQSTEKAYLGDDDDELQAIRTRRLQNIKSQAAAQESRRKRLAGESDGTSEAKLSGHFGHLREVGHDQYVQAIENENESTFVVVHIYVKYVHACAMLTSALSSIARMYPNAKFLQIRAGCIGFGSGGLHDVEAQDVDEEALDEKAEEVVPTLLVYRKSVMLANLVRVDLDPRWGDGSERCIQQILEEAGVLS